MSEESQKPLPLIRLAVYVLIVVGCGAVLAREVYYALGCDSALGTVRSIGTTRTSGRSAVYHANYDYLDAHEALHTGRAEYVFPNLEPGTRVRVQYFRHAPAVSRLAPSPVWALSFASIALLAIVVFAAEIVTRRPGWVKSWMRR